MKALCYSKINLQFIMNSQLIKYVIDIFSARFNNYTIKNRTTTNEIKRKLEKQYIFTIINGNGNNNNE